MPSTKQTQNAIPADLKERLWASLLAASRMTRDREPVGCTTSFTLDRTGSLQPVAANDPEELAKVPQTPGTLREALNALEADNAYLLKGDVFTEDVIRTWIQYKMENEVDPVRCRPHPYEFALYYDI